MYYQEVRPLIVRLGPSAAPDLVRALHSDDKLVRRRAAALLKGLRGRRSMPVLRDHRDPDPR